MRRDIQNNTNYNCIKNNNRNQKWKIKNNKNILFFIRKISSINHEKKIRRHSQSTQGIISLVVRKRRELVLKTNARETYIGCHPLIKCTEKESHELFSGPHESPKLHSFLSLHMLHDTQIRIIFHKVAFWCLPNHSSLGC